MAIMVSMYSFCILCSYMFFADLGNQGNAKYPAKIERAYMDGSRRYVLVKDKLVAPMAITVDIIGQRIYWTDAHMDHIMTIDYFGQNMLVLLLFSKLCFPC